MSAEDRLCSVDKCAHVGIHLFPVKLCEADAALIISGRGMLVVRVQPLKLAWEVPPPGEVDGADLP